MCGRGIGNLLFPLVAAGVLVNESARPVTVGSSQATCPNCKTKVLTSFDWCPECGTGLKSQACMYCGNQMESNARFCPSCGAPTRGKGKS